MAIPTTATMRWDDPAQSVPEPEPPAVSLAHLLPEGATDATAFNAPEGPRFFRTRRGQRCHVRLALPEEPRAVVFFLHGYGAHVSGPSPLALAEGLTKEGFAVFLHDHVGHGYSDGHRAYVDSYRFWVEDALQLVSIVMAGGKFTAADEGALNLPDGYSERLQKLPFALAGQSLGGGMCILAGLMIQRAEGFDAALRERFLGTALMCPAIVGG